MNIKQYFCLREGMEGWHGETEVKEEEKERRGQRENEDTKDNTE
jgi:hypothetical protein